MKLRFTDRGSADLQAIRTYIERDSPKAAGHVVRRIRSAAENLRRFSEMGRLGSDKGTRELIVSGLPYILIYEIDAAAEFVIVLNVVHTARDRIRRGT